MSPSTIQCYPLTPETISAALQLLRPHLPVSLPLHRRLQFGRFFENSTLLSNLPTLSDPPSGEWLLAFIDRTVRPETEVWIFGSWESSQPPSTTNEREQDEILLNLATKVGELPLPESLHQDILDEATNIKDHSGVSRSEYAGHMTNPKIVLCGAVHSSTTKILERTGLVKGDGSVRLVPNHMYVFYLESGDGGEEELPAGLRWGELRYSDFALVRSRTQIPRQDKTLAVLPNLGIFDEGRKDPVAWAFVGLDGALTTLHVEEAYRKRGLAKVLTRKLFREKMEFLWEDGVKKQAHGYVIEGNSGSCAVCESLGGKANWDVFWIRLDLSAAERNA